ncbi:MULTISPECIES: VOC family protein [unclassified Rhizobium]|uniref:glyoxalase n=1 Tax=unclassified Rhizobium TaxID=2613769 RepID=UPI001ADA300E|nr:MULTISPECIES: glyoxalase [unclassified Rhizobium]MBO9123745.1 glyoxalase [Rhizobium sp. 16-488-2b]MBO9174277.1 glyoxalase [Rhizobium sp. 16-488-2a]
MQLDHVTIRTRDIAGTREFFETVFDLTEGPRPAKIQGIPGHWLYANGAPLVHIIGSPGYGVGHPAEAIDHVGFRLEGYQAFRTKLERLNVRYSKMDLPEIQERRLFFHAPGGPLLEAVFSEPLPQE